MKRSLVPALAALCAAMLFPGSSASSTALKGPGIIRITSRETNFTRVDTGTVGRSPGDMEISRLQLYNTRIRQRPIGHGQLVCIYVGDNLRVDAVGAADAGLRGIWLDRAGSNAPSPAAVTRITSLTTLAASLI